MLLGVGLSVALRGVPLFPASPCWAQRCFTTLHDRGGHAAPGFSDQQVDMIRHHHMACNNEAVALPSVFPELAEDSREQVAALRRGQPRLPVIATAIDEVQMSSVASRVGG